MPVRNAQTTLLWPGAGDNRAATQERSQDMPILQLQAGVCAPCRRTARAMKYVPAIRNNTISTDSSTQCVRGL